MKNINEVPNLRVFLSSSFFGVLVFHRMRQSAVMFMG